MAWDFDAFAPLTTSATLITFAATQDFGGNTVEVHVIGTGLSYNPLTGVFGGTITNLELVDITGGHVLQTVTVDPTAVLATAANATALLQDALVVKNDFATLLSLPAYADAQPVFDTLLGKITITLYNDVAHTITVGTIEIASRK